jgi:membrane protein DedA with SNARE-associated domain
MSKPLQFVLELAAALAAAALAPVLTFFVGYFSCWVLARVTGDPRYMGYMILVALVAVLTFPAAVIIMAIIVKRRERQSQGANAPRGFPVNR